MEFKDRLFEARRKKGMSQEDLANICLVSRQAVSKWENGSARPDSENLLLIARCLDVSIDDLLGNIRKEKEVINIQIPYAYEYKSKVTVFGLPLLHIHLRNRYFALQGLAPCRAKGIIAIGNTAIGVIAIGLASIGIISFGILSLGLVFSLGVFALGYYAGGAIAIGYFAFGAIAIGIYTVGAIAFAKEVAVGGVTFAKYSFGARPYGTHIFKIDQDQICIVGQQLKDSIPMDEFPRIINFLLRSFHNIC